MSNEDATDEELNSPATGGMDFSMLLASSVHDIKNSLGMLLSSLDEVIEVSSTETPEQRKRFSILRGEASRINNSLMYLLGLYRIQTKQLSLSLDEVFVSEFLEEQLASQELLLEINKINSIIQCDENLVGYFDEQLVAGIVSNIIVNCAKYTRDEIILRAEKADDYLQITIIDNGGGYPQKILDHISNSERGIDFTSGSTNLGLFFSQQIANMHHCKQRRGYIELANQPEGGGCFKLFIP